MVRGRETRISYQSGESVAINQKEKKMRNERVQTGGGHRGEAYPVIWTVLNESHQQSAHLHQTE